MTLAREAWAGGYRRDLTLGAEWIFSGHQGRGAAASGPRRTTQYDPTTGASGTNTWPGACALTVKLALNPVMTESKGCRMITILILYIAQGIPIGLLEFATPAWMAANGATGAEIGYVIGMAGLPWSLKFFNGALMDRYAYLPMGRRRAWIIGAQVMMVVALCLCALMGPGPRDYLLLGIIALIVNLAVVFQDVAADALTVDISPEEERGFVGGVMAGGQGLGIALAAGLAGSVIIMFGISMAYLVCGLAMACVTAYLVWVRERVGERRVPWSAGAPHPASLAIHSTSWWAMIKNAFRHMIRRDSLVWLVPLFLTGMIYGIMTVATPLIAANYAGWNEADLGAANGMAYLAGSLLAIFGASYMIAAFGIKTVLIGSLAASLVAVGALVAAEDRWSSDLTIWAIIFGWISLNAVIASAKSAANMAFCDPETGATQFSIYMALSNQGISFAAFSYAFFEGLGGPAGPLVALGGALVLAIGFAAIMQIPKAAGSPPAEAELAIAAAM